MTYTKPKERPTIETERLILRPFCLTDAPAVQKLAGDIEIARNTNAIPHPYEDGMAEEWIGTHQAKFEEGKLVNFANVLRETGQLIGAIGLVVAIEDDRAELGYWVGKPYWNSGYCTEAARAVLDYGFNVMGLNLINAHHMSRNAASGKVMQKIGMKHIATLPQWIKKWGEFVDLELCVILKSDFKR